MTFFGPDLRNGLPIGLGSVAGFGIAPRFSPASLFLGGTVNGAWYDPSDATTLFSDRAGTTPCGTPGGGSVVPVGLMLDKSQGLVLGSELVSGTWANGTAFPFDTFTASGTGFTGNKTGFGYSQAVLPTAILVTTGKIYCLTAVVAQATDDVITIGMQDNSGGGGVGLTTSATFNTVTSSTTIIRYLRATANGTAYLQFTNFGTSVTLNVTSVSVRELAGNHAIAANDTTARPELRARVNLLTYSEQFDNAAWSKTATSVVANTIVTPDPLGGNAADKLEETAVNSPHYINIASISSVANTVYSLSIYAKAAERTFIQFLFVSGEISGNPRANFDLSTGQLGSVDAGLSATITPVGNGWYRCSVTFTAAATTLTPIFGIVTSSTAARASSYLGVAGNGIYIWGAQLTATNEFPANTYQRIVDANTYDAVGFPRYLVANGTSSAMSTPANVNLSGTDKVTVFAGVRKLSDAAAGTLFESSANSATNAGAFSAFAPDSVSVRYGFYSRGTVAPGASANTTSNTYQAPITNVLTGLGDISADQMILRLNASQISSVTLDQGTGNYGTYPLFIGSRNNSSIFFNGNIYSLIVVGSAVSAGNITSTEQWVAGKVGITI